MATMLPSLSSGAPVMVNKASGLVEIDVSNGPAPGHYEGATLDQVTDAYTKAIGQKHTNANADLTSAYGTMKTVEQNIRTARAEYNAAQAAKATLRPGTNAHTTQKLKSNAAAATLARLGAPPKFKQAVTMWRTTSKRAAANAELKRVIKAKKAACGWGWLGAPRGAAGVCESSKSIEEWAKRQPTVLTAQGSAGGAEKAGGSRKRRVNKKSKKTRRH
jgi:hypothetical protein